MFYVAIPFFHSWQAFCCKGDNALRLWLWRIDLNPCRPQSLLTCVHLQFGFRISDWSNIVSRLWPLQFWFCWMQLHASLSMQMLCLLWSGPGAERCCQLTEVCDVIWAMYCIIPRNDCSCCVSVGDFKPEIFSTLVGSGLTPCLL